jgi:hypothetical protein
MQDTAAVSPEDCAVACRVVAEYSSRGAQISRVVDALVETLRITPARSRFVVRAALDRGYLRTDSRFYLHAASAL